jgi:putative ABC transport system permease protein
MKFRLYWSYAARSLRRGGQRTVLAMFCVAVGVMAIIALQLVGLSVDSALIGNIIAVNGGDIRLSSDLSPLRPRDLPYLNQLKRQGRITDYATAYDAGGSITQPSGPEVAFDFYGVSSNFPLVGQPNFAAPAHNLTLQDVLRGNDVAVSSLVYDELHAQIGNVYHVKTLDGRLVTIKVAAEFQEGGAFTGPQVIIARATLDAVPSSDGKPFPAQYSSIYITAPASNVSALKNQLAKQYPSARVITAQDLLKQRQSQVNQIELFLRIVGLLALFIGGIGIINTMQVLLRRRQIEIAMLKTMGYRRVDLYALFGLEAALLGLVGGIFGTAAGIGASFLVGFVVANAFYLQLNVALDPLTIGSGVVIGLATALIFGLLPIAQASQIRPLNILRESSEGQHASSRFTMLGLLALLSLLFVVLAATILGDPLTAAIAVYGGCGVVFALALGFGVLVQVISRLPVYDRPRLHMALWLLRAFGIALAAGLLLAGLGYLGVQANNALTAQGESEIGTYALIALGGLGIVLCGGALVYLLANIVNSVVMFLPRPWKTAVMLAYRNIGRQRVRTTTTLTALFVGVFAIGLILILGQGIKSAINTSLSNIFTRNVFVIVAPDQRQAVANQSPHLPGVDASKTLFNPYVPVIYPILLDGHDINTILKNVTSKDKIAKDDILGNLTNLEGFDLKAGKSNYPVFKLVKGRNLTTKDAGTNNVIMSSLLEDAPVRLRLGQTVVVQSSDGTVVKVLKVVGFYDGISPTSNTNYGNILADLNVAEQLGGSTTLEVFSMKVDPNQLPAFKQQLYKSVPSAIIFSIIDIDSIINQVLDNVVVMLTTIASLAMIAGLIIIANAVALAMLERRREIGILKSVGHTSRSILATVLIENGMVGMLGSLVAMLLVIGAITALSAFVFHVTIGLGPGLIGLVIGATALVTMLVAALVSWRAVQVRPLDVLRYE